MNEEENVQEQGGSDVQSCTPAPNSGDAHFGVKDAIIFIVALAVVFFLFTKIVLPALIPTYHSTTEFIKDLNNPEKEQE